MIMTNHSAEDIEVLCDTVSEMDLGVLKKIKYTLFVRPVLSGFIWL